MNTGNDFCYEICGGALDVFGFSRFEVISPYLLTGDATDGVRGFWQFEVERKLIER